MSTATKFVSFGHWPKNFCGNYPASPSSFSNATDFAELVGPFNEGEVMDMIWNCETVYQTTSINSISATYGGSTSPGNRICNSVSVHTYNIGGIFGTELLMCDKVYYDGTNYYVPFHCMSWTIDSNNYEYLMTNYSASLGSGYVLDHSFTGTIYGKTETIYCWKNATVAWPFSDSFSVTLALWTY